MNEAHFREVLEEIEAHPERWGQGTYCGTACCLAGRSQLLVQGRANEMTVIQDAMRNLGINELEGWYLFASKRTIADFRQWLEATEEQRFAIAVEDDPATALGGYLDGLTPGQLDFVIKQYPIFALAWYRGRMTPEQALVAFHTLYGMTGTVVVAFDSECPQPIGTVLRSFFGADISPYRLIIDMEARPEDWYRQVRIIQRILPHFDTQRKDTAGHLLYLCRVEHDE